MLSNKQKTTILESETLATIKGGIKTFETLKNKTEKAYKDYYNAKEEANAFYWHGSDLYKAYEGKTVEERGAKQKELWQTASKLETAHTIAKHNETIQARYICDLFARLISFDWWNLKDRKGVESVAELLSQETGARFGAYCDGGSIKTEQEKSYIYYNLYFNGFRRWHTFAGTEPKEPKEPKMLTFSKFEKLQAKEKAAKKKVCELLGTLKAEIEGEQVRDLLGEWEYKSSLYSLKD